MFAEAETARKTIKINTMEMEWVLFSTHQCKMSPLQAGLAPQPTKRNNDSGPPVP